MEQDHLQIPKVIIRHGIPNAFDHAPFGTHCKVVRADGSCEIWQQMGPHEDNPRWERIDWEDK